MKDLPIRGYCDRPNVAPGERLDFHVSCAGPSRYHARLVRLRHGDLHPDGPGLRLKALASNIEGSYRGARQRTQLGSYVEIPDPAGRLAARGGFALHLFLWPTTPQATQTVLSRMRARDRRGWALVLEDGYLSFVIGDGRRTRRITAARRLFAETWYSVTVSLDAGGKHARLTQQAVVNSVNGRLGPVVPLACDDAVDARLGLLPADAGVPVIIGGMAEGRAAGTRQWVQADFNGKLDAPKIFAGPLAPADIAGLAQGALPALPRLAHWDFAAGITRQGIPGDDVIDIAGGALHGRCVNQPDRAMTGWNWDGNEEHFVHCPQQYGALWFHADALDDCRWPVAFTLAVPARLASGVYAVELECDGARDYVPFFVTPPRGRATAKVAVLLPTFSYLAYANTQVLQNVPGQAVMGILTSLGDRDLELNRRWREYGLSTYDLHSDGRGCQYSSWRRPILNMRPDYRHEFGAVWQFPADLHLIDWLEQRGTRYDVITDHDLAAEGVALLARYRVVMTCSHPEYYSAGMLNAWESYLANGGRGMYLAGNGFYWVTSQHPHKPWLIEVRKGESGDQAWRARPGELFHSTTGERGGLWRMRGRAPQKIWGVGYTAHCLDVSCGFVQMPDARDRRLAWMMRGIGRDEVIGDFGLVNGGAAGLEVDRIDYALGTPPHTLLVASSHGLSANAMLVPEEQYFAHPGADGTQDPLVRGDIVYFTTAHGGGVFSASSMAWCGSLSHHGYDNNVARLTGNVLDRFAADAPLNDVS